MKLGKHISHTTIQDSRLVLYFGFLGILIIAFSLRLYGFLSYPNIHHPDELFQYLEQAHRLVFGYGIVPWEFRDGTRSWLFPGFLAGLMKLSAGLGYSQPEAYGVLIASVLSVLSLSVVLSGFLWAYRVQGIAAAFITATLCSVWFELIYFAPKTLTEVVAAHTLVIAVYLAWPGRMTDNQWRLFAAGLLFGLTVSLRVHLSPTLIVAAIYICRLEFRTKWVPLAAGVMLVIFLAGMLDTLTWGYPFYSFVENIRVNIMENRSHLYGIEPWSFYLKKWVAIWGPATLPIVFFSLLAIRRNALLGLILASILLTHMLFAHKEYRFVYPAIPFIVMLAGLGTAEVFGKLQLHLKSRLAAHITLAGIILSWSALSAVQAFSGAFNGNWYLHANALSASAVLRDREDLCGVGLPDGGIWYFSSGYTYLHKNVPFILPIDPSHALYPAYNYALARPEFFSGDGPYTPISCWKGEEICIYRRAGPCKHMPEMEANEVLKRLGG